MPARKRTENEEEAKAGARLRAAGLRPTRQRAALAGLLFRGGDRHVSAEALHAEAIRAGYDAGLRDFGENRVQEMSEKRAQLGDLEASWHFIGHLQSNKARPAASMFELIHSLDSMRLAQALHKVHPTPPIRVLLEINLGAEKSKR